MCKASIARSENTELKALYDEVCRNTANLEAEIGQMKTDHTHAINAVKREYEDAQCILLSKLTNPEVGFNKCFAQDQLLKLLHIVNHCLNFDLLFFVLCDHSLSGLSCC